MKSIHDHSTPTLALPQNHCFGCGKDNPEGMGLDFTFDESTRRTRCEFTLERRYQGPPGHAHGGIIATILDEAMGKVNKFRQVIALTKTMDIEYLKPVPLGQPLIVEGHEQSVEGRKHRNAAELRNGKGELLARSTALFIAVDAAKMFEKHLNPPQELTE
jgi:acyl-coenzyme A thioesterase PaaI-like protein